MSGHLAARYEESQQKISTTESNRDSWRTEVQMNLSGFVWDPRFMVFNGGITLLNEEINTDAGESNPTTTNYSLFTTWFPRKKNPFIFFANRSLINVSSYATPSYELVTDNVGMRWGFRSPLLGALRFTYDLRLAESDAQHSERDEVSHHFNAEAKKKLRPGRWGASDLIYGYRYETTEDKTSRGSESQQHYVYANDHTDFGERVRFTADATLFNREDDWGDGDRTMTNLSASARLNVNETDQFTHYYQMSTNMSETDEGQFSSFGVGGGLDYRITELWRTFGSLNFNGVSSTIGDSEDQVTSSLNAGVEYSRPLGIYNVYARYAFGITEALSGSSDVRDTNSTQHSIGLGASQRATPLWMDSITYSANYSDGNTRDSLSQNLTYRAVSNLSIKDILNLTLELRTFSEKTKQDSATLVDRDTNNRRIDLGWQHRISSYSSLSTTAGYTETDNDADGDLKTTSRSYAKGEYQTALFQRRNLSFKGTLTYEDLQGDTGNVGTHLKAEADVLYYLGRWQASMEYRYIDADYESNPFEEHTVTLYLKRLFGVRF